jgi:holo-[acyl-carrier protein] synthase
MNVVSHGIDIVEVARIARLLADHPHRFRERVFTLSELEYSSASKREVEHLAARFAAKEAAFKALGTGLAHGMTWQDIEVCRAPSGEPSITLHGAAQHVAAARGIVRMLLSMSHTHSAAVASVIALRE